MRDIGADVRKRRKRADMTQQDVADLMGWSVKKVSMIENNHQPPTASEYLDLVGMLAGSRKVASFMYRGEGGRPLVRA